MQNLPLKEDIKVLLKKFLNGESLMDDAWKKETEKVATTAFSNSIYEGYINRINITTPFIESNVERIKPYQLKYNIRRFWFKEEESALATAPGEIVVSQEGVKIILKEGEYINGGGLENIKPVSNLKDIKEFVYVYRPRKFFTQKDNIYIYTHGEFLLRNYYEPIIRFYFSLAPKRDEVQQFIDKIKDFFNKRRIPFNFKTPLKLENFGRGDTLVLYVAQNHFFYVSEFISELRNFALKNDILRTNIPLFVKKIYEGVGFAEDPFFVDDSFGMQRVKLIIKVISDQLNLQQKVTLDSILKGIENEGYNIEEFYKNPYTNFDYNFENFDAPITLNTPYPFKVGTTMYSKYNQLALEYALDLIGRAVWNDKNELIWFTYERENNVEKYRLLNENEVIDIYCFLSKVVQINYNRNFFTKSVLKIIDDITFLSEHEISNKERVKNIQNRLNISINSFNHMAADDFEKNYEKLMTDVKKWSDIDQISKFTEKQKPLFNKFRMNIKSNLQSFLQKHPTLTLPQTGEIFGENQGDFDKEHTLNMAEAIYPFAKMEYPILNKFENYEYCPTYYGRLTIASIMLCAYCPSLYEELI